MRKLKGKGGTLAGGKTKGKGINHRGVEDVADSSKVIRTEFYQPLFGAVRC